MQPISFMDVEIKLRVSAVRKRPFCPATAANRPFMVDRNAPKRASDELIATVISALAAFSPQVLSSGAFHPTEMFHWMVLRPTEGRLTSSIRRPEEDDG